MKTKFIKSRVIFVLFIFSVVVLSSCLPEDPSDPDPARARDKFLGTWLCTEENKLSYLVAIVESPDNVNNVLLMNFHHFGQSESVIGEISGSAISLPQQAACQNTWFVNGSGLMSANRNSITFQYSVSDGANSRTVNATYTKQ